MILKNIDEIVNFDENKIQEVAEPFLDLTNPSSTDFYIEENLLNSLLFELSMLKHLVGFENVISGLFPIDFYNKTVEEVQDKFFKLFMNSNTDGKNDKKVINFFNSLTFKFRAYN